MGLQGGRYRFFPRGKAREQGLKRHFPRAEPEMLVRCPVVVVQVQVQAKGGKGFYPARGVPAFRAQGEGVPVAEIEADADFGQVQGADQPGQGFGVEFVGILQEERRFSQGGQIFPICPPI